jgi:hypothetical protein
LERARLLSGEAVSLIDLSLRGAQFQVATRLTPGEPTALELVADGQPLIVSGQVIRSEIASVLGETIHYRGACAFATDLPWDSRLRAAEPEPQDGELILTEAGRYRPWWGWSEALLVFRHSRRLSGFTRGFFGSEKTIEVWPSRTALPHEKQIVPLTLLRAIYFLRDFDELGASLPDVRETNGHPRVEIAFTNNERFLGTMPPDDKRQPGFWVLPLERRDIRRMFAVSSAVSEIRALA